MTLEWEWQQAVATTVDVFGSLTTLVNNAGLLHRASIADESVDGFERSWRVNCLGAFHRYPGGARAAACRRRRRHRQHLQHRRDPAVPEPRRLRLGEMGAARADPGRGRRTRAGRNPSQRGVPRTHRDTDAGCRDPNPVDGHVGIRAGSANRPKWPMRSHSWCRSRPRSSPARNSSSTAANASRSNNGRPPGRCRGDGPATRPGAARGRDDPHRSVRRVHDRRAARRARRAAQRGRRRHRRHRCVDQRPGCLRDTGTRLPRRADTGAGRHLLPCRRIRARQPGHRPPSVR